MAHIALLRKEWDAVRSAIQQRLALAQQIGSRIDMVWCLNYSAHLAQARGDLVRATCLLAALMRAHEALSYPIQPAGKADLEKLIQAARDGLSQDEFASAWRAGEMLEMEKALSLGLQEEVAVTIQ